MYNLPRIVVWGAGLALVSCAVWMEQFKTSLTQSIQHVPVKEQGSTEGVGVSSNPEPINQSLASNNSTKAIQKEWPMLSTLIDNETEQIINDVQFLLDFAIVAHPKCATSFTQNWLRSHPDILMHQNELHSWHHSNGATDLVRNMYQLPSGSEYLRGYKAPRDLIRPNALAGFVNYFPQTKLIVGIRHPVHWFESFYNFRVRQNESMPPAELLADSCKQGKGVCSDEARFHVHLGVLGKTPLKDAAEWDLLDPIDGQPEGLNFDGYPRLSNPVFLYEIQQLSDANATRRAQYQADLEEFLGLQSPLSELQMQTHPENKGIPLDICEDTYQHLRNVLMEQARLAAVWIIDYFLMAPDVTVSSPEYLRALLETWKTDPCDDPSSHQGE